MFRFVNPLTRLDWYFYSTKNYRDSKKRIQECSDFMQHLINDTKRDITSENAKTFIQFLCCDSNKRPEPLSSEDIQNKLQMIIFAVSYRPKINS